jgi:thioesterase domain-containing protein/acyl carrier protein
MTNSYEEISQLSPEKRVLLEKLMKEEGIDVSNLPLSKRISLENIPLSSSQERLWSLWNLAPENPSENVYIALEIKGDLNKAALDKSISELVKQNEIFRTYCVSNGSSVFQKIVTELSIEIEDHNLENLNDELKTLEAAKFIKNQIAIPFDLSKLPTLRVIIINLAKDHYILLIITHQFVSDGYSANLILQYISDYYNKISKGEVVKEREVPFDYGDYAIWQRKRIEGSIGDKQIKFWKGKLKDLPTQISFNVDHSIDTLDKYNASILSFSFSKELSERLRTFSSKEGFSIFMLLLSGLLVTLQRLTQQDKIMITTSVSTRGTSETENIIGNFSNNLMLDSDFSDDATLMDTLKQARINVGEAFTNQDLPLEYLITKLQEEESSQSIPRIQILFMLRDKNAEDLFKLDGLEIKKFPIDFEHTKLDMLFDVFTSGSEIKSTLTYKKELFSKELIEEFAEKFEKNLEEIVNNPNSPVDSLPSFKNYSLSTSNNKFVTEYISPRNDTEKKITKIWEKFFNKKSIGVKDNYFDLGGHSLLALVIFNEIEKEFNKKLPLATLFKSQTIEKLAAIISDRDGTTNWSSIVPIQTQGTNPPFFCIHGAGGNVLLYKDLAARIGNLQPFYGLQSKGLDGSEDLHKTIAEMAENYLNDILQIQPEGPYLLGGYCMGGTIAYEIAQQLIDKGLKVGLVALMDTYNFNAASRNDTLLANLGYYYQNTMFHLKNLIKVSNKEKIIFLKEKAKTAGERTGEKISFITTKLTSKFSNNGNAGSLQSLQKLNDQAALSYIPEPYNGKVVVFTPQDMFANFDDESFGWGELVKDNLKIVELPIYPKGMLVEPFVEKLASSLRAEIEDAIQS